MNSSELFNIEHFSDFRFYIFRFFDFSIFGFSIFDFSIFDFLIFRFFDFSDFRSRDFGFSDFEFLIFLQGICQKTKNIRKKTLVLRFRSLEIKKKFLRASFGAWWRHFCDVWGEKKIRQAGFFLKKILLVNIFKEMPLQQYPF